VLGLASFLPSPTTPGTANDLIPLIIWKVILCQAAFNLMKIIININLLGNLSGVDFNPTSPDTFTTISDLEFPEDLRMPKNWLAITEWTFSNLRLCS
jgi:hypothetical protein